MPAKVAGLAPAKNQPPTHYFISVWLTKYRCLADKISGTFLTHLAGPEKKAP